ncbi:MAG: hypothetical protein OJF48_002039 [Afipia sp.]|nr:MAG: hypothetical protein OJF48_002039 [Afipia sp.]
MAAKAPPYPAADVASGFAAGSAKRGARCARWLSMVRCLAATVAGYESSRSGW